MAVIVISSVSNLISDALLLVGYQRVTSMRVFIHSSITGGASAEGPTTELFCCAILENTQFIKKFCLCARVHKSFSKTFALGYSKQHIWKNSRAVAGISFVIIVRFSLAKKKKAN